MDTLTNTLGAADPTGALSAAGAAVGLVCTVLRAVPALKNATHAMKSQSNSNSGPTTLHRAQTAFPAAEIGIDPERERRAYETVNFVLRELGSRICAAGLVDEYALTKALNSAAQHIDFNLFSQEGNRLFASLAPKLGDPTLVNSVFTSIYFIGALTAELARSLPNYKDTYTPLGPRIVQQLFRTAIGEDAFRENLTGNLDAYKTLATTAGLLRPTDIGYSAFPGFPALSPCRYSSRSFNDVRNNKFMYEKLVKHFDRSGFPQPIPSRQAEVGVIKDWRFLAGNTPSRTFEVERADKNIGESFGRVLHWLLCSADNLPPGQAVIAYYDQHVQLIKWIEQRMGYCVLFSATDLNWSGVHVQLDRKIRAVSDTWVILMRSERAQAKWRASSAQWSQSHMGSIPQATSNQPSQPERQSFQSTSLPPAESEVETPPGESAVSWTQAPSASPQAVGSQVPTRKQSSAKTIDQRLDDVERDFNNNLFPQCNRFLTTPPLDTKAREIEYIRLTQHIEKAIIGWLDQFPIPEGHPARARRKAMIVHAQQVLAAFDRMPQPAPKPTARDVVELTGSAPVTELQALHASTTSPPNASSSQSPPYPLAAFSPPPYSPTPPPSTASSIAPSTLSFSEKPRGKTAIRRKPPPPPKKFIAAKALYDFEPDTDNDEEMEFKEGDDIEIIGKNAALEEEGWCRARVKGMERIGLVPLEYLEIEQKVSAPMQATARNRLSSAPSMTAHHSPQNASNNRMGQHPHTSRVPHPGLPPQQPGPSHPVAHTNVPFAHPQPSNPAHTNDRLEKTLEVAGLGGATAEVITVIQGKNHSGGDTNAEPVIEVPQQWQDSINNNQQSIPKNISMNQQDNSTETVPTNYPKFIPKIPPPTAATFDDNSSPPPMMDLSAFSSPPFEPQTPIAEPTPIAPWTTVDPYPIPQNPSSSNSPDSSSAIPTSTMDLPRNLSPPPFDVDYSSTPPPPPAIDYTTPLAATSPVTSFANPTPLTTDGYSTPLALPADSPSLSANDLADDEADSAVAFSQLSTDSIVDDDDEMDGAIAAGQDYDDDDDDDDVNNDGDGGYCS